MATSKQQSYLQILFDDLGFSRAGRNAFLSREIGREISYLDELSNIEASTSQKPMNEELED